MLEPKATIIIPNHNGMMYLPRLLESLARQTERRHEVVVVDDTSRDESVAYLRGQWPSVRVLCNERNLGFAGTCNVGLRAATTPIVVLLNNDTHVDGNWLHEGLLAFENEDIAAAASLVLLADPPHLIDTAGDEYSVVGGAMKRMHMQPRSAAENLDETCFSASGASAFYRREAVARVGYLEERFESYYEDVDLGFRLAWAGYRCRFAPKSICYHHLSSSYSPKGWTYHFNSARNAEIVWRANMPESMQKRHGAARRLFLLIQGANKMRQGCFRAWRAGRKAAGTMGEMISEKRAALPHADAEAVTRIESLLVHDWWAFHVRSRFQQRAAGDPRG
ncbi:MAG: glycosyltransferase family 2 protein [Planctomycetes bacterium]|nr:glycosyltransferase family 2 protein [Planctomycetota bacterium]